MTSNKYASLLSFRGGGIADMTKSIEKQGPNFLSNPGSGFNLTGHSSQDPAAKLLSQLCRGEALALGPDSQQHISANDQAIQ